MIVSFLDVLGCQFLENIKKLGGWHGMAWHRCAHRGWQGCGRSWHMRRPFANKGNLLLQMLLPKYFYCRLQHSTCPIVLLTFPVALVQPRATWFAAPVLPRAALPRFATTASSPTEANKSKPPAVILVWLVGFLMAPLSPFTPGVPIAFKPEGSLLLPLPLFKLPPLPLFKLPPLFRSLPLFKLAVSCSFTNAIQPLWIPRI